MQSERTVWAEGMGLSVEQVEALTLIAEEAQRRGLEVNLDPRDVWSAWPVALDAAGAEDLADRVRELDPASINEATMVALARVARLAGRDATRPVGALALQQHTAQDLEALHPEVAEAVRAVSATQPGGWGWGTHPRTRERIQDREGERLALAAALDAHYPGLTR